MYTNIYVLKTHFIDANAKCDFDSPTGWAEKKIDTLDH